MESTGQNETAAVFETLKDVGDKGRLENNSKTLDET